MSGQISSFSLQSRPDDGKNEPPIIRYCMILEGLTEYCYFSRLEINDLLKRNGPEIILIEKKDKIYQDESDRKKMIFIAYNERKYVNEGLPTLNYFVTCILNQIYIKCIGHRDFKKIEFELKNNNKRNSYDYSSITREFLLFITKDIVDILRKENSFAKNENTIVNQFEELCPGVDLIVNKNADGIKKRTLDAIRTIVTDNLSQLESFKDDSIPFNEIDDYHTIVRCIGKIVSNNLFGIGISDFLPYERPHVNEYEKICVVFDRDYSKKYRDEKYYSETIEIIRKMNYRAIVTTPLFELWLLMHLKSDSYNGVEAYDKQYVLDELKKYELKEYSKLLKDKEFGDLAKKHIDELNSRKKKKNKPMDKCRFKMYRKTVGDAVKKSLESPPFTTDVEELNYEVGSNIGLFMEQILKDKYLR